MIITKGLNSSLITKGYDFYYNLLKDLFNDVKIKKHELTSARGILDNKKMLNPIMELTSARGNINNIKMVRTKTEFTSSRTME